MQKEKISQTIKTVILYPVLYAKRNKDYLQKRSDSQGFGYYFLSRSTCYCGLPDITHLLYRFHLHFISQIMHFFTGIEIHPGAKIDRGVFIDHGMGVVIGQTAEIGNDCIFFNGITLGSDGKYEGKRHPTIGNNVFIGCQETLLAPITAGDYVKIGAETVIINHDIPSNYTDVGAPGRIVKLNGKK